MYETDAPKYASPSHELFANNRALARIWDGCCCAEDARAENPKYDLKNQHLQHCTLQAPFARDNKHKKLCQFMWLYLTYLLFDSRSLKVKSAEETRFQV